MVKSYLEIKDLIGIPFLNGGRDPNIGLDCWGLFRLSFKIMNGFYPPDYKISCTDTSRISGAMAVSLQQWEKLEEPIIGCAVSMAIDPQFPNVSQHFGVCTTKRKFIHTLEKTGAIEVDLSHMFWKNKITGFWKWQG